MLGWNYDQAVAQDPVYRATLLYFINRGHFPSGDGLLSITTLCIR
jgi:hypothetical protein